MKTIFFLAVSIAATSAIAAKSNGYLRKDGTYVAPYFKTAPNSTRVDNYSTKGNENPYTGKKGTVEPYKAPKQTNKNWK